MTVAPLAFYPDTNQWSVVPPTPVIPPSVSFDSPSDLAGTNFGGSPPDYVSIAMPDGRPQNFQRVADYPVAVIERLGNPSFNGIDFWGFTPPNADITGGNLIFTTNANVTQTGVRTTVVGGTYEFRTNVTSWTSGQVTPSLLVTGGVGTAITAAGVNVQRVTPTVVSTTFRLTSTAGTSMTIASASYKRVMTNACVISADGLIWAPVGDINVLTYGVVADGVTNDTAALLNATTISINLGRKALLPAAPMRVTGQIVDFLGSGLVQIEGDPGRTILINEITSAVSMFSIQGRFDGWSANGIYLTAAATQGTRTLTVNDTSQLAVGQDVQVKDFSQPIEYHDKIYGDDVTRVSALNGEVNRVKSIDSSTQVTLAAQVEFDFAPRTVLAGTVSTTSGVNVVTGVGTAFDTDLAAHQYVTIAGVSSGGPLKIRKIVSATVLWIDITTTPLTSTVSGAVITSLGTVVQRWLDRPEAQISGIRAIGSTAVTVPNTNLIYDFRGLRRCTLDNLGFLATGCSELSLWRCLRSKISNYHSEDAARVGFDSYCIKLLNGTQGVQIVNGYAMRPRHFITTTNDETELEAAWVLLSNCHVDQPMVGAFDQHPGGRNWLFSNCSAHGADFDGSSAVGFELRAHDITLVNCQASGLRHGLTLAYGYNLQIDSFLANNCDISCYITQAHHVDIRNLVSRNALTNDISINAHEWGTPAALPSIRVQGRGEGNPSGASVTLDAATTIFGDDWRLDFRNPDAALKYRSSIPSSHTHGIIAKSANFNVSPNLTCIYRTTGTVTATLPLLSVDTGEATYTFTEVSGALTIAGNGAETIDGVASITPTGTVRVKKNGEAGSWISW